MPHGHSKRYKSCYGFAELQVAQMLDNADAAVQDTVEVELVVKPEQCPHCKKSYTEHKEKAIVQVLQAHRAKTCIRNRKGLVIAFGVGKELMRSGVAQ